MCVCAAPRKGEGQPHFCREQEGFSLSSLLSEHLYPACTGWVRERRREGEGRGRGRHTGPPLRHKTSLICAFYTSHIASLVSCLSVVEDISLTLFPTHTRQLIFFFFFLFSFSFSRRFTSLFYLFFIFIYENSCSLCCRTPFPARDVCLHCQCTSCAIVCGIPFN